MAVGWGGGGRGARHRTFLFTMRVSPRNFLPLLICHDCGTCLEIPVPIYRIVDLTTTATNKIGRSIPAPGKVPLRPPAKLPANP